MVHLIVKDILVQKKQVFISFAYILILIFALQSLGTAMFSAGIVAFTYMLIMNACAFEDKNKADILLNSLPVKRTGIIAAKYLSVLVFFLMGTAAYVIVTGVITVSGIPVRVYPLTLEGLVGGGTAVSLLAGLYFPVFFKLGYMRSRAINFILFFVFFFGISTVSGYLQKAGGGFWNSPAVNFVYSLGDTSIALLIAAGALLFLFLSYGLSVKFYQNREF